MKTIEIKIDGDDFVEFHITAKKICNMGFYKEAHIQMSFCPSGTDKIKPILVKINENQTVMELISKALISVVQDLEVSDA